jgi:hypothetical protein
MPPYRERTHDAPAICAICAICGHRGPGRLFCASHMAHMAHMAQGAGMSTNPPPPDVLAALQADREKTRNYMRERYGLRKSASGLLMA